ncbi:hypothetical protein [Nostoc sp. WHI]|uniref:hypothetical protein n=1 Tax=Nostoc sp. WHI TaxID=2650611 RepID=UPI0018C6808A|nr:hypothetical protein [Nostoc sp. WHI]MBG1271419.1 hypothetical protein [Nostoc sp. WHI]
MLKPVSYKTDQHRAYQQALDDFGITELLAKLNNYSDADFDSAWIQLQQQEIESLAAILISQLTYSLNGKLIAAYLNLIRHSNQDIVPSLINLKCPDASIELPDNFPDVAKTPRFLYGDRLRWLSTESDTDWGIVIGRFYSFGCDRCCWSWCYLIWLSKDCPSAAWTSADIAWEEDLEAISEETDL